MGEERRLALGKTPSPAQESVPAAPECKECPGALLCKRQLIMRCLFRAADSASLSGTSDRSRLLENVRSAIVPADIFSSAFFNRLSVSCTRVNSQIVVVFSTTRPAWWSPDH